jgi:hypothetical protein
LSQQAQMAAAEKFKVRPRTHVLPGLVRYIYYKCLIE